MYKTCNFFFFFTWFPHRLESEDHARPWFCPTLVIFIFFILGFPIGLSLRTMQGLGSVQNLMPPFFYAPGLPSGISQVSEREVALGNCYSLAWAVVRGSPCRMGLRRELTKPTDLEVFPWSLVTQYFLASQCSRCAFTRLL